MGILVCLITIHKFKLAITTFHVVKRDHLFDGGPSTCSVNLVSFPPLRLPFKRVDSAVRGTIHRSISGDEGVPVAKRAGPKCGWDVGRWIAGGCIGQWGRTLFSPCRRASGMRRSPRSPSCLEAVNEE